MSDMAKALSDNIASLVGIARPFVHMPDLPNRILDEGFRGKVSLPRVTTRLPFVDNALGGVLVISWYELQMQNIARNKRVSTKGNGMAAMKFALGKHGAGALSPRRAGGHN